METKLIPTVEAMEQFAADCAAHIDTINTLYLKGELGAGKTSFVRGLLKKLGHVGSVKSPTYTLVEPYFLQGRNIYHFDLYRLNDPEELEAIGVRDYFTEQSLCLVEWPEKAGNFLLEPDVLFNIEYCEESRTIKADAMSEKGKTFLSKLG